MQVDNAGSLASKPSEVGAEDIHAGSIPATRVGNIVWDHFSS